jgi:hypothetical protein
MMRRSIISHFYPQPGDLPQPQLPQPLLHQKAQSSSNFQTLPHNLVKSLAVLLASPTLPTAHNSSITLQRFQPAAGCF